MLDRYSTSDHIQLVILRMDSQTTCHVLSAGCSPAVFLQRGLPTERAPLFFPLMSFIPCFPRNLLATLGTPLPCERRDHILASVTSYCLFFCLSMLESLPLVFLALFVYYYLKELSVLLNRFFV